MEVNSIWVMQCQVAVAREGVVVLGLNVHYLSLRQMSCPVDVSA